MVEWAVLAVIVVVGLIWVSNRPSQGTISYRSNRPTPTSGQIQTHFTGKKISFGYWPGYEVRSNDEIGDNYSIVGPSGVSDLWTIILTKNSSLDENSGVLMRRAKKDVYEEMPYFNGVIFTNKNGNEKVYFEDKNFGLLSVAVTNFADSKEIDKKMDELLGSIK